MRKSEAFACIFAKFVKQRSGASVSGAQKNALCVFKKLALQVFLRLLCNKQNMRKREAFACIFAKFAKQRSGASVSGAPKTRYAFLKNLPCKFFCDYYIHIIPICKPFFTAFLIFIDILDFYFFTLSH